jgi:hypothetical protein
VPAIRGNLTHDQGRAPQARRSGNWRERRACRDLRDCRARGLRLGTGSMCRRSQQSGVAYVPHQFRHPDRSAEDRSDVPTLNPLSAGYNTNTCCPSGLFVTQISRPPRQLPTVLGVHSISSPPFNLRGSRLALVKVPSGGFLRHRWVRGTGSLILGAWVRSLRVQCTGWAGGLHVDVPEFAVDVTGYEPARRTWPFPQVARRSAARRLGNTALPPTLL